MVNSKPKQFAAFKYSFFILFLISMHQIDKIVILLCTFHPHLDSLKIHQRSHDPIISSGIRGGCVLGKHILSWYTWWLIYLTNRALRQGVVLGLRNLSTFQTDGLIIFDLTPTLKQKTIVAYLPRFSTTQSLNKWFIYRSMNSSYMVSHNIKWF